MACSRYESATILAACACQIAEMLITDLSATSMSDHIQGCGRHSSVWRQGRYSPCRPGNQDSRVWFPPLIGCTTMITSLLASLSQSESNLIGLGPDLSWEERTDVLDLLDHAEGFANRFLDRHELWKSWLDRFRNRLEKHGCASLESLSQPPQVVGSFAEFDGQLGPIGTGHIPAILARQARDALDVLRGSQFARRFFETGAQDGLSSSFMLTPCHKDAEDGINFAVYAFRLNTTVETRDFDFWTEVRRDMVVWKIGTAYRFDREQFAGFREQIHADLTHWSRRALLELPID